MSNNIQDSIKQNESTDSEQLPNDLLQQRFDLIRENAPKSKDQFYQQSFDIFSRLNDCVKGNDSVEYKESKKTEISHIVSEYVDLVHEFPEASEFEPIWDLAYLLYFSTKENDLVTNLNDWVNQYGSHLNYTKDDMLKSITDIALHHTLRGNFIEAVEALNDSLADLDQVQLTATQAIIQLLQKFRALQLIRDDKVKYAAGWTELHEECGIQLENFLRDFDNREKSDVDSDFKSLLCVLNGDEDYILYAGDYFEKIIGCILYSRPTINKSDLAHLAQMVVLDEELDASRYIMMGCFDSAFEVANDLWLQTHLGHALITVGAKTTDPVPVESTETEYIIDPVYYCIDQYATMLAEKNNLWKEAVIYITACVENREIWIKTLLNESALKSKDMSLLNSVLDIAEKHDLSSVQKYIHKVIGHRYEEKKEIKKATIEYGKAHDLESLDRFAHHEFSQFLRTGKLGDVVTHMEELKECPHYALLILYHNFRVHLEKKEWKRASQLLLQLIEHEHLPTKFEMVLLTDNIAILEDSKPHYSLDQLIDQIKLFKAVTVELSAQDFLATYYKSVYHKELPSNTVTAILREKMVHKAVIASN
ncbi:Nup85 nucleoporin-domain-containing protein [Thamnidium elegans]|nr:Nup85 nucleoporin-domain-containing protein [Thamnidium elegans]